MGESGRVRRTPVLKDATLAALREVLASQREQGGDSYPAVVSRLFELAGLPQDPVAMRELANRRASRLLRVTAKQGNRTRPHPDDHYARALAFLPEDAERVANTPALLRHALERARTDSMQAFTPAELADTVPGHLERPFKEALQRRVAARATPAAVGMLRRNRAWILFLVDDVVGGRPAVAPEGARVADAERPYAADG